MVVERRDAPRAGVRCYAHSWNDQEETVSEESTPKPKKAPAKKPAAKKAPAAKASTTKAAAAAAAVEEAVTEAAPAKKSTKERVFTPTAEAKSKATSKRVIALILWAVAIGLEAFAIFWIMRPPFDELVANQGFPQNRWYMLLGAIAVIAILAIVGSLLWKQANRLDPASEKEKFRFFVQNQLGAIIALIAFLPLIIVIYTNKDMDSKQKNIAGAVGIVAALAAVLVGIDFKPFSQEQAAVEAQVVAQLTGEDVVFWTQGGKVMHLCEGVSDLANSASIEQTSTAEALDAGKEGITLKISQELSQCGLPEPENVDEIVDWVREARAEAATGTTDTSDDEADVDDENESEEVDE